MEYDGVRSCKLQDGAADGGKRRIERCFYTDCALAVVQLSLQKGGKGDPGRFMITMPT
jgi:hypothetical protein